jgi:hypothetical protein
VAGALRKEPGTEVEIVSGNKGEFTVSVDGRIVAQKGESLPAVDQVVDAVRKATPVGAGV